MGNPRDRDLERLDHEQVLIRRGSRSGLYAFVAIHSTVRGAALGGCRMWVYDDPLAALGDSLRLSRTMTYKAAVSGLPFGGGKGVIMVPRALPSRRRHATLLDFADVVNSLTGRYITAEDVGTSSRDMGLLADHTRYVAGLPRRRGGSGDPSPFTALGLEHAIRACCERVFGTSSLRGKAVCVLGLGHVGSRLAKRCARAGARLLVADIDQRKRQLARQLGARWASADRALTAEVEVLAPCALGGVLDEVAVSRLRCRIVAGAANNQLADERAAELMAARGILWAPDFVVNAGGIINIAEEFGQYDPAAARRRVRAIGDTLQQIFDDAQAAEVTPLVAAMALARKRLTPSA